MPKDMNDKAGILDLIQKLAILLGPTPTPQMSEMKPRQVNPTPSYPRAGVGLIHTSGINKGLHRDMDFGTFMEGYRERGRRARPELNEGLLDRIFPSARKMRYENVKEETKALRKTSRKRRVGLAPEL